MTKLIVGIDPGTTTGIAMISLDACFCHVFSKKNLSLSNICSYISECGDPVIVATDVAKPPVLVKKVAATFGAALFSPRDDITQEKKRRLAKAKKLRNRHEKDALAAALNARNSFMNLFLKVDKILKGRGMLYINDDVKDLLIRKKASNIAQAVRLAF